MIKSYSLGVASMLSIASPALAQDTRNTIWNDLRVGMTKEEVKSLYPKSETRISPNCFARLYPDYQKKGLVSVRLQIIGRSCSTMLVEGLTSKYGEGRTEETKESTWIKGYYLENIHYYWMGNGVALHLSHLKTNTDDCDLSYTISDKLDVVNF